LECYGFGGNKLFGRENPIKIWLSSKNSHWECLSFQIYGNGKFIPKIKHCVRKFYSLVSSREWVGRIIQQDPDEYNKKRVDIK
jgi:hypothetical protein